jgi:hypothetical protein
MSVNEVKMTKSLTFEEGNNYFIKFTYYECFNGIYTYTGKTRDLRRLKVALFENLTQKLEITVSPWYHKEHFICVTFVTLELRHTTSCDIFEIEMTNEYVLK